MLGCCCGGRNPYRATYEGMLHRTTNERAQRPLLAERCRPHLFHLPRRDTDRHHRREVLRCKLSA